MLGQALIAITYGQGIYIGDPSIWTALPGLLNMLLINRSHSGKPAVQDV